MAIVHVGSINEAGWEDTKSFVHHFMNTVEQEFFDPWFGVSIFSASGSGFDYTYTGQLLQKMSPDRLAVETAVNGQPRLLF